MTPHTISKDDYVIFSLIGYRKSAKNTVDGYVSNFGNICLADFSESSNQTKNIANQKSTKCSLMVVALDLGTTRSGYSFVFTKDKSQVRYMQKGKNKVPTILLLDPNKKFHSFGYEAQSYFQDLDLKETQKWYYFENFKMALHNKSGLLGNLKLSNCSNNRQLDAKLVFSLALKYLCSQAIDEISDQLAFKLTKEDITWVITVPALWKESAIQFMREAAIATNLVCSDQLHIALEPEVASLFCRISYEEQLKSVDAAWPICKIEQGTNYVIIDAGGGSVDVTFHQILQNSDCTGYIQELRKSTGLPCGSNQINKAFEKMLASILGSELWQKFRIKYAASYNDLMNKFELRKREVTLERKKVYNIALPFGFIQFFALNDISIEQKFKDADSLKGLRFSTKLGIIRLDAVLMQQLFDSVVEPMKRHIKGEINDLLVKHSVKYAFLVGGFAQSAVLRYKMKEALEPETLLVFPPSPHLAVLHGAALFGLNPTIIRIRRAMRTYGIGVLDRIGQRKHTADRKTILLKGEKWRCDVFDRFVTINEPVGLFETIIRRYSPVLDNQTFCLLHIYSTEQENAATCDEEHVSKCGTIYLELEPLQLAGEVNPAIKKLVKREIEAEIFFGEREIKISVTDLQTKKLAKAHINFLNKNS